MTRQWAGVASRTIMNDDLMLKRADETETSDDEDLTVDRVFKLLKNSRRRRIIDYLSEDGRPTTRSRLAEVIAAEENGISASELGSDQRKRVYVSLYQTHLPTLARDDVIEYDGDRGTVAPGRNMQELIRYLRLAPEPIEATPNAHHIGLSLIGGVTYAAIRFSGELTPGVMDLWAAGFVLLVFLVSMTLQRE